MEVDEGDIQENALKDEHSEFTEAKIKQFYDFAKDPQLYEKLIDAFAPSIWEN